MYRQLMGQDQVVPAEYGPPYVLTLAGNLFAGAPPSIPAASLPSPTCAGSYFFLAVKLPA
jgi:hypothetical protein